MAKSAEASGQSSEGNVETTSRGGRPTEFTIAARTWRRCSCCRGAGSGRQGGEAQARGNVQQACPVAGQTPRTRVVDAESSRLVKGRRSLAQRRGTRQPTAHMSDAGVSAHRGSARTSTSGAMTSSSAGCGRTAALAREIPSAECASWRRRAAPTACPAPCARARSWSSEARTRPWDVPASRPAIPRARGQRDPSIAPGCSVTLTGFAAES